MSRSGTYLVAATIVTPGPTSAWTATNRSLITSGDGTEDSRPWFAQLRALAGEHGLRELSMGTTQDYAVAAEEGATYVRVGSILFRD